MTGVQRSGPMSLDEWRRAGKTFLFDGRRIFYREDGAGPALLLIHGFPTASWDWNRIWLDLCARFRVVAPDLLGFGFSAKPKDHAYSIFEQADVCDRLLAERGVADTHVLAHDYGDTVAQELLARHEERRFARKAGLRLRSVCFLNGGLFPEAHRARFIQRMLLGRFGPLLGRLSNERSFGRSFSAVFARKTRPSKAELREFWTLMRADDGHLIGHELIRYIPERKRNRERWVGALQKASIPLRVIDGALDPVSGAHMVERYRQLVRDADVVSLPGVGHYPQLEAPERLPAFWSA